MSKFYVYNLIPLDLPTSSRYGKDKHVPANSRFVVVGFDGEACEIKLAGRGNYRTSQVSINFLAIRCTLPKYGPVVSISLADFLRYSKYETPSIRR